MKQDKKIEVFLEKIKSLYLNDFETIKNTISKKPEQVFRLNTILAKNIDEISVQYENELLENSYIYKGEENISLTKDWQEHKIYAQSLSSMLPALSIKDKLNDVKVLDLCAAPGSKTTQIASLMQNTGEIVAVEPDRQRFSRLKRNCSEQGVTNASFINTRGEFLTKNYPEYLEYFDVVFADVPCSNENKLNITDPKTFQFWNPKKIKGIAKLQKKILKEGLNSLKAGGALLYSTCTYSIEENEMLIDSILKNNENIYLDEITFSEKVPLVNGFSKYNDKVFDNSLTKTKRISPENNFRAFFLAKLRKSN